MGDEIRGFIKILIKSGVITKDMFVDASQTAKTTGTTVAEALVSLGYATDIEVVKAIAEDSQLDFVDLSHSDVADEVIELMLSLIHI